MKQVLVSLALAGCLAAPLTARAQHSGGASSRPALTPAKEARQFDFLIGQWELVVTPKVSSLAAKIHGAPKLLGSWKAWRAVDGFGLEDELRVVDRSGNPSSLLQTLRVYDATNSKWQLTGIEAYRGRVSTAAAEWKNNEMVTSSQGTDEEGKPYIARTRFFDITANGFKYQQDRSYDGGKTWDEALLRIEAKRVAATAPR